MYLYYDKYFVYLMIAKIVCRIGLCYFVLFCFVFLVSDLPTCVYKCIELVACLDCCRINLVILTNVLYENKYLCVENK